jgi:hypothetical protein
VQSLNKKSAFEFELSQEMRPQTDSHNNTEESNDDIASAFNFQLL